MKTTDPINLIVVKSDQISKGYTIKTALGNIVGSRLIRGQEIVPGWFYETMQTTIKEAFEQKHRMEMFLNQPAKKKRKKDEPVDY